MQEGLVAEALGSSFLVVVCYGVEQGEALPGHGVFEEHFVEERRLFLALPFVVAQLRCGLLSQAEVECLHRGVEAADGDAFSGLVCAVALASVSSSHAASGMCSASSLRYFLAPRLR